MLRSSWLSAVSSRDTVNMEVGVLLRGCLAASGNDALNNTKWNPEDGGGLSPVSSGKTKAITPKSFGAAG